MPEPYVGDVTAPVVLLTLNPGVSDEDLALHRDAEFRARIKECHRHALNAYPNYYLDPAVTGPGARWLHRVARPLVQEFGAQSVSRGLTLLEFLPYHSIGFAHARVRVPSQAYAFALVAAAVRRGAAVFITRGRTLWYEAVPELRDCRTVFFTRSVQNIVISPRNAPEGYAAAAAAISALAV